MINIDDVDIRVHHRSQMDAAGLQRIIAHCRTFGVAVIDSYTHFILGFLEGINKTSQTTMEDLVRHPRPCPLALHLTH